MVKRDKNGKWLKGTPPPNPSGRPKVDKMLRERARIFIDEEGFEKLVAEVRTKGPEWFRSVKLLLAYAYGSPPQTFDATVSVRSLGTVPSPVLEQVEQMLLEANQAEAEAEAPQGE